MSHRPLAKQKCSSCHTFPGPQLPALPGSAGHSLPPNAFFLKNISNRHNCKTIKTVSFDIAFPLSGCQQFWAPRRLRQPTICINLCGWIWLMVLRMNPGFLMCLRSMCHGSLWVMIGPSFKDRMRWFFILQKTQAVAPFQKHGVAIFPEGANFLYQIEIALVLHSTLCRFTCVTL